MKKNNKTGIIKILAVTILSVMLFCSCGKISDSASKLIDAVASSVGNEIGSAINEGIGEFKSGMSEAASAVDSARDQITEQVSSVREMVGDQITSVIDDAVNAMTTTGTVSMPDSPGSLNENPAPETSISSDDTTDVPETKQYTFRNKQRYDEHYEKHGAEFGDITKEQYLELANELINSQSDRVLHKYSEDGDYMYFDQDTGYFLVLSEDGYIRTFFIPSAGIKYWNRQ